MSIVNQNGKKTLFKIQLYLTVPSYDKNLELSYVNM